MTDRQKERKQMSEDEFVVLLEHAGIVETSDDCAQEFVEQAQLLDWLEREGIELFSAKFFQKHNEYKIGNGDENNGDDDDIGAIDLELRMLAAGESLSRQARSQLAIRILDRLVQQQWIAPIEFDSDASETEDWKAILYGLRLPTAEAYKVYIEKDSGEANVGARGRDFWTQDVVKDTSEGDDNTGAMTTPNELYQMQIREKMWQNCFPMCSENSKQTFLSFDNPEIILYSTLGLNLISNGISSVPAFSRELKNMNVSAEDRTIIVGFLAKAFPCE